ncbi:aldo/keto reductase [Haloplanus halobius]|uniref:aldo/keto reductase n=1 Tax=Haloplanus halobius TaxID=2934938 RepID=UPI00200D77FC|nr:aldo/keto reductase [Haloplanus sp. XH21]
MSQSPNEPPMLGLGTWQNTDPEACANAVATALELGYRHIDTAQAYDNEEHVGDGLAQADIPRDDIFLATKVWIDQLAPDDVLSSTEESLDELGVDYVDLLYVHWPAGDYDAAETLAAFERLRDEGKIDHIGISNFEPDQVTEAIEVTDAPIFANQIECHPFLPQTELRDHCAANDIEVVAYSPLARGEVFDSPEIQAVAEKHDASEAQVSLAWLREKGVTAIPKATSETHIRDNWASRSVELDADDVARIDAIDERKRLVDPDFAPW